MGSYWNYRECEDQEHVCGGTPDDEPDEGETVAGQCELCKASPILKATGLCSHCTMEMI